MPTVEEIQQRFAAQGNSQYGQEAVSQLEHALQAATLAEEAGATPELIVAALLHDVGHLLHDLSDDAPDRGIDDHHETSGDNYLKQAFPLAVTEPVRLHVAAKRYLCTVDPGYHEKLSEPSIVSLNLQGGAMTPTEVQEFEGNSYSKAAVLLRQWDDQAKVIDLQTPDLIHFVTYLNQTINRGTQA